MIVLDGHPFGLVESFEFPSEFWRLTGKGGNVIELCRLLIYLIIFDVIFVFISEKKEATAECNEKIQAD